LFDDPQNVAVFSTASLSEIAIKRGLGRRDFRVDARVLRRDLLDNGKTSCRSPVSTPSRWKACSRLHKDPFDRMLIAQSVVEGITLADPDRVIAH
jgi:PIN domain nuclease of toxin-antitoxin system